MQGALRRYLPKIAAIASALLLCSGTAFAKRHAQIRTEGNSVTLYNYGGDFYRDLAAALEGAKRYICFEYYSVGKDSVSTAILNLLQRKASEGVRVYAMIDNYGSRNRWMPIDDERIDELRAAGLDLALFNTHSVTSPLPRDHRKLTVIDGITAFVGGMNIHDRYVYGSNLGRVGDFTFRLEGPVVPILQQTFEESWNTWSDHPRISLPQPSDASLAHWNDGVGCVDVPLTVEPTDGWETSPTVCDNYLEVIRSAKKSIVLVNAYFMPSSPILGALKAAARRGVKIDLVVGENTDLPKLLEKRPFRILNNLARTGNIDLHVVENTFFHAKGISIDGERLLLGSANLDYLSRTTNYELDILVENPELARLFEESLL